MKTKAEIERIYRFNRDLVIELDLIHAADQILREDEMKTNEEIQIWDALELLTKAKYAIDAVAAKTKDKHVYRDFANAAEKIKEVERALVPLSG